MPAGNGRLSQSLKDLLVERFAHSELQNSFLKRLGEGNLTRDENPKIHFCVYFAAYDPSAKQIFLGHHKKSGLWLFNGGHIDEGETVWEALKREIAEEWGIETPIERMKPPRLLTLTEIENPAKQTCKLHYDI